MTTRPQATPAHTPGPYVVLCDEYLDQPFDAGTVRHIDIFQDRDDAEFYVTQKDEATGGGLGFHAVPLSVLRQAPALLAALEQIERDEIVGPHWKCRMCDERSPAHAPDCWVGKVREMARAAIAAARGQS